MGGKEENVCIFFSDIRGFTKISENIGPKILVEHLNEYFSLMINIIHKHEGILDKFIGDAAMAVFGVTNEIKMCDNALNAAIEIQEQLKEFNKMSLAKNLPVFNTGIGLHSGFALLGNIGSKERLEYTVIGDTVNIASRIESMTKNLNTSVLISDTVYQSLTEKQNIKEAGIVKLKGKEGEFTLYQLS